MLGVLHVFILLISSTALGSKRTPKINITSAKDLADFSLRSKTISENHAVLCVLADLDFSDTNYTPIQNFHGTFDGQGYLVKNFHTNGTVIGSLFAHSSGMTIRNVIMDSSCSIVNEEAQPWIGGLIGSCLGSSLPCVIENSVNMGKITYSIEDAHFGSAMIGGIIGTCLGGKPYECRIRNCANHGSINIVLRNCEDFVTFAGGIAGCVEGVTKNTGYSYVFNSINYGTINYLDYNESSNYTFIGGLIGSLKSKAALENCVSTGGLSEKASSISGYVFGYPIIRSCFWYMGLGEPFSEFQDNISASNMMAFDDNFYVGETNRSLVTSMLNQFTDPKLTEKSGWLINMNENTVSFYVNNRKRVVLKNQIMLVPSLTGGKFSGWHTDKKLDTPISLKDNITEKKSFYSRFHESFNEELYKTTTAGIVIGYILLVTLFIMVIGFVVFLIIHMYKTSSRAIYTTIN